MAEKKDIIISGASVKVMRSYDYCHFEVALSTAEDKPLDSGKVDELRKEAMRLADKAVEQYKIAKRIAEGKFERQYMRSRIIREAEEAWKVPEAERTPMQKAAIKAAEDYNFYMQFEYDYEDDWDEDAWEAAEDAL